MMLKRLPVTIVQPRMSGLIDAVLMPPIIPSFAGPTVTAPRIIIPATAGINGAANHGAATK